jgi:chemotaxis protein CheC
MVGEQVFLSVPSVEVVTQVVAAKLIGQRENDLLVAVRQDFEGAFSGRALLIFPEPKSLELVRAVAGEDVSQEELAEMEDEALAETGNIILNGCLATIGNMLQRSLTVSLPEVIRGDGRLLFEVAGERSTDGLVLFLYINFSIRNRDITGYIAMVMDLPSLAALTLLIDDFIQRIVGTDL